MSHILQIAAEALMRCVWPQVLVNMTASTIGTSAHNCEIKINGSSVGFPTPLTDLSLNVKMEQESAGRYVVLCILQSHQLILLSRQRGLCS